MKITLKLFPREISYDQILFDTRKKSSFFVVPLVDSMFFKNTFFVSYDDSLSSPFTSMDSCGSFN